MYRLALLFIVLSFGTSCSSKDPAGGPEVGSTATRLVDGLGLFQLDSDEMWEGQVDTNGGSVKVFLHAHQIDFDTLAEYAKRVLARSPLPDKPMLADVEQGIEDLAWKFKEFHFDVSQVELHQFRVERLVIGKDFDGPDIELGINLSYPGDINQWHLKYFREGNLGSLNWIPRTK